MTDALGTDATAPIADGGGAGLPVLDLGGAASAAWREEALTRAIELGGLAKWIEVQREQAGTSAEERRLASRVAEQLDRASKTAAAEDRAPGNFWMRPWWRFKRSFGGATVERTLGTLDAVETDLLRLAPDDYVCSLMPSLVAHVNRYLPKDDPRRMSLTSFAAKAEKEPLSASERGVAIAAFHAANSQRRRELLRLRTFRNVIACVSVLVLLLAAGLGILGWREPDLLPICFQPGGKVVCPTEETPVPGAEAASAAGGAAAVSAAAAGTRDVDRTIAKTVSPWDIGLVEIVGLVAAAVASAFALRGIRGTSTPYSLPVALAALKLGTGALTAFLGLMLMRGNFVPGLSALDSSAQIISWAIVFGYSQQLFTRFVDQQAHNVLESVGGRGAAGDRRIGHD